MYQIIPKKPRFYHIEDYETFVEFVFTPRIESRIMYLDNSKQRALIQIDYFLECLFKDAKKPKSIFSSITQDFEIIKNDELDLMPKSETGYECIKIIEKEFGNYLATKKHKLTLIGIGIFPISLESWLGRGQAQKQKYKSN